MKKLSFLLRSSLFAAFILLSVTGIFGQDERVAGDLSRTFAKFDLVHISSRDARRAADARQTVNIAAGGKNFSLKLEPRDLMSPRYRAENQTSKGSAPLARPQVNTFKGTVNGDNSSEARLTIDGASIEGYFTTGSDRFFVEPARKYSGAATDDDLIVYREEDAIDPVTMKCNSELINRVEGGKDLVASRLPEDAQAIRVIELATDADFEYVTALHSPAQANAEILSILNMTEGVYRAQLGLTISVTFQHTWSTADPFTGAGDDSFVRNLAAYWEANFPRTTYPRDLMHLFTGDADKLARGFAFIGVLCRVPSLAYGYSGYVDWAPAKFLVTTHEIGHNLGGNHVDAAQGADCANSLMNAQLTATTPMTFCAYSQNEISTYVNANNACLATLGAALFDFDADGRSDISVFRPSDGSWYINRSRAGFTGYRFGQQGDVPVAADYDGDGRADTAVYRAGVWYRLKSSDNSFDGISFGLPTDLPAPGDFDGDGKADVAVFRPSDGNWYQLLTGSGFTQVHFGAGGDVPVPADFDGDGKSDVNVFRPATGSWFRLNSRDGSFFGMAFGAAGDKPVAGDFDGDGKADITVFRPSTGGWYMMRSATNSFAATNFGIAVDIPAAADFDGDGKSDISVYRPTTGDWFRLDSATGAFYAEHFGAAGDQPVPSYYIP